MNKAILIGRLTANPELKTTPSGANVCSFTIAVDRKYVKQGEERKADFINCVAWNKTAEFICKYFTKGRFIGICGSIQTRDWEDQNGNKRYATEVIVEEAYFTEGKASGAGSGQATAQPENDFAMPVNVNEDDLPFL